MAAPRCTLPVALLVAVLAAACDEAPAPDCPADRADDPICERGTFCVPAPTEPPPHAAVSPLYTRCATSLPVPDTEPSHVGESAVFLPGDTCEREREQGEVVCCYAYTITCER